MVRITATAGLVLLTAAGMSSPIRAEATKEFFKDAGLYNAAGPMNILTWNGGSIVFNAKDTSDPSPPEGKESARMQLGSWGGFGIFNVASGGSFTIVPRDFSEYAGGTLRFWLKSTAPLTLEIEHTAQGTKSSAVQVGSTGGNWSSIVLNLSNFSGVDYTKVIGPFLITAAGATTFSVDHVRWTKPLQSFEVYPASLGLITGSKRQLTVEGRDASGDVVVLYPDFSAPASVGTVNPSIRTRYSILTGGSADGNVTIHSVLGSISKTVPIDIRPAEANETFGLISETVSGLNLDVDSKIGVNAGGGGVSPVLLEETSADVREGSKRFRTTVKSQTAASSFAGWFVQWSTNDSDTVTRDMSGFYEGSVRFWFKGPPALQDHLEFGIRSGNVPAGEETSKSPLKNYVAFDNSWHAVAIPLADFAKAPPFADLSRMKVLFSLFAVGNTGSSDQVFYVDNLRWDSRLPGTIASMSVSPADVFVPVLTNREFRAKGFDSNGVEVDIWPEWDFPGASLGTLSATQGVTTRLTAQATPVSGTLRVRVTSPVSASTQATVDVGTVTFTQSMNVYSDAGAGGFLGAAFGGGPGTSITLDELTGPANNPPEGSNIMRATYSLDDTSAGAGDSWALWFVEEPSNARFLKSYESGYLHFAVRTARDLQVSVRSDNIVPGNEQSKIRLSELGIPTDGSWQDVWVTLSDLKAKEPNLDFEQMKTLFAIGGLSNQIGEVTSDTFDVDDVYWATSNPAAPDPDKIYHGLLEKQQPSGLVRSFETLDRAVTYDQALALMNFTYRKDLSNSQALLDVYKSKFEGESPFQGFRDEYDVNTANVLVSSRSVGPNAWMLLAILHYRAVSGQTTYDAMMNGLASWILARQDADGGVRFGFAADGSARNEKSTEHNFDAYAAFEALAHATGNSSYAAAAENVRRWLETDAYNAAESRFNVGETAGGSADTAKALDAYSWAPLALSSYTSVISLAEVDFSTAHVNDRTGILVHGFDFAGAGPAPDKDSVWLEGTAHMALAYYVTGSTDTADFYINELNKAVVSLSATGQGLTYATNMGTGFGGFMMDSLNPAVSSMAWYLFVHQRFNPFRPVPEIKAVLKNMSDNQAASEIQWTVGVPNRWARANQYIEIDVQPVSVDTYGIQIYTDNADPSSRPQFVDPSPGNSANLDSNPAGLLFNLNDPATTYMTLPMAWSVKDDLAEAPAAFDPSTVCPGFAAPPPAYQWHFMRDRGTPALDLDGDGSVGGECDAPAFVDGELSSVVQNQNGLHAAQGDGFFPAVDHTHYVFIETDFTGAAAQTNYRTVFTLEYFFE